MRIKDFLIGTVSAGITLLVLDIFWLGTLGQPIYEEKIGQFLAEDPDLVGAVLFYAMYLGVLWFHAIAPAHSLRDAAKRGAGMGFLAYGTWNLTNWAVFKGWDPSIAPIDWTWGIFLTTTGAAAGYAAVNAFSSVDTSPAG